MNSRRLWLWLVPAVGFAIHSPAAAGDNSPQASNTVPAAGRENTAPMREPTEEESRRIQTLIQQLADDNYFSREQAQRDLARLGLVAFDDLCVAQGSPNLEIASRARFLVQSLSVDLSLPDDPPAIHAILKDFATAEDDVRRQKIASLAEQLDAGGMSALCRLARYEASELLSKLAALAITRQSLPQEINWSAQKQPMLKLLGASKRRATIWVRSFLQWQTAGSPEELAEAATAWDQLVEAEAALVRAGSGQSSREILSDLYKVQVQQLVRMNRQEQASAVVMQVVANDAGTAESAAALIRWLADQKQWTGLDGLEVRFAEAFTRDPLLWYELAEARHKQGQTDVAQEHAKRGLEIFKGDTSARFRVALALRQRGLMRWCEAELFTLLKDSPKTDTYAIYTRTLLSEILHDRAENHEASEMIRLALEGMAENDKNNKSEENPFRADAQEQRVKELKSRMQFFIAMHFKDTDPAKHVHHLDEAIAIDPIDADALIALFRLPDATEERRKKTSQLIRDAVSKLREQTKSDASNATPHNQLAWLVGNTEGDIQEAIEMSKKSLELRPNTAAYLDTLGRCYFTAGDLGNAVRYQAMAVAQEPWSQQMQRQLQLFRKAQREAAIAKP